MMARVRGARADEGFTLIEMIITVAILGIAIVGLISGLFAIVVARHTDRLVTRSGAYLLTYAEAVKAADYEPCTTSGAYTAVTISAADYALNVLAVECWNGDEPATFAGGGSAGASDRGAQRVSLSVVGPSSAPASRQVTETVMVYKRSEEAPT